MKKPSLLLLLSALSCFASQQVFADVARLSLNDLSEQAVKQSGLERDFIANDKLDAFDKNLKKMLDASANIHLPDPEETEKRDVQRAHLTRLKKKPVEHTKVAWVPHVGVSLEGMYSKGDSSDSMLRITHSTNADPATETVLARTSLANTQARLGWAFSLEDAYDSKGSVFLDYRYIKEKTNPVTSTYNSLTQFRSDTTSVSNGDGYATGDGLRDPFSGTAIGDDNKNKAFAVLSAVDTLLEEAHSEYQQLTLGWGRPIQVSNRFLVQPRVGFGWRHLGYRDTVTFSSLGSHSNATPTTNGVDYFRHATRSNGQYIELNGEYAQDLHLPTAYPGSSGYMQVDGELHFRHDGTQISAENGFTVLDNSEYDSSDGTYYLANLVPSYRSKINALGPSLSLNGHYGLSSSFSMVGGLGFSMVYGRLKTSGYTTNFTLRDLASGGQTITNASASGVQENVNIQATSRTAFSFSSRKIVPELEWNLGLRYEGNMTKAGKLDAYLDQHTSEPIFDYYLEFGYRMIKDWSAAKAIDLATSTLSDTKSMNNRGVYLKAGFDFDS